MEDRELSELLSAHFEAWEHMSASEQKQMLTNADLISYTQGMTVYNGENDCVGFMIIKSGRLRVYMLSEEGKEITLYRLGHGDMCILAASCALSSITFDVHIEAEENTEVYVVGSVRFTELVKNNIYIECFSYKLATDRFSDVMWAMQQILFMSMDKRLAIFLWDELAKSEGNIIRITHEQAARYIGSAREVVTRMLKYFAGEGIVELSRGGIKVIDKGKLRKLTL
mgnify:CR=1 FL=1